jgi:Uma2 family endonuclease
MSKTHQFTVAEWHDMGTLDRFGPSAHIELLDGEVFDMSPLGPGHQAALARLLRLMVPLLGDDGVAVPGGPVELDDQSEPEPDLAIVRYRADFYEGAHARPQDVLLLVEVSDSSLSFDQGRKGAAYAKAGIFEYWIVDLKHEQIVAMREPGPAGFGWTQISRRGQFMAIAALPHIELAVSDILAPLS